MSSMTALMPGQKEALPNNRPKDGDIITDAKRGPHVYADVNRPRYYSDRVNQDSANLENLSGVQRDAQLDWLKAYTGLDNKDNNFSGYYGHYGIWRNPSMSNGKVGYDDRKEQYLQDWYKNKIKQNQVNAYNAFDVDNYVKQNSDIYRRNLADQFMQGKKQIQGNENARGMLFSGHRQNAEGQLGAQTDATFRQYQQDIVKDALAKKQQLAADPLAGIANSSSQDLDRYMQNQELQNGLSDYRSQLLNSGVGLIGKGIGNIAGSRTGSTSGASSSAGAAPNGDESWGLR